MAIFLTVRVLGYDLGIARVAGSIMFCLLTVVMSARVGVIFRLIFCIAGCDPASANMNAFGDGP